MSELLVVANPKRRRRRRRKLSAKQIAAGFGGKRHKRRSHRRHRSRRRHVVAAAPRRHRRRRHSGGVRRPAVGYTVGTKRIRRRKLNPMRRHRYRRHRNPMSMRGVTGAFMPTVKDGFTGALGALGLDVLWGFAAGNATIGAYVSNQYVGFAAKLLGAVLVGAVGGKVMRGKGRELAVGAATVAEHDFLKSLLQSMAPTIFGAGGSVPLGAYLSGSAPIVGTTSVPQSYLPFGAYLSGSSGSADANGGQFMEDTTGMGPWCADGRY